MSARPPYAASGIPPGREWMARIDQRDQARAVDVGVDLRRRDVGMAEQRLQDAQVGAPFEQVRREGVAQDVRRYRFG